MWRNLSGCFKKTFFLPCFPPPETSLRRPACPPPNCHSACHAAKLPRRLPRRLAPRPPSPHPSCPHPSFPRPSLLRPSRPSPPRTPPPNSRAACHAAKQPHTNPPLSAPSAFRGAPWANFWHRRTANPVRAREAILSVRLFGENPPPGEKPAPGKTGPRQTRPQAKNQPQAKPRSQAKTAPLRHPLRRSAYPAAKLPHTNPPLSAPSSF